MASYVVELPLNAASKTVINSILEDAAKALNISSDNLEIWNGSSKISLDKPINDQIMVELKFKRGNKIPSLTNSNPVENINSTQTATAESEHNNIDIFISYNVASSKSIANELKKWLQEHGVSVWMCTEEMHGGDQFREEIIKAIEKSKVVIPLINRNWAKSEECQYECNFAMRLKLTKKRPFILPLLLETFDWTQFPLLSGLMANTAAINYQFSEPIGTFKEIAAIFPKNGINLSKSIDNLGAPNIEHKYMHVVKNSKPIAYWPLSEEGDSFFDLSGNNITFAISNATKRYPGPFNDNMLCPEFVSNVRLDCGTSNHPAHITNEFTLEAWIKRNKQSVDDKQVANYKIFEINHHQISVTQGSSWFLTYGIHAFCVENIAVIQSNSKPILDTKWHHLVLTRDLKNNWTFYEDGEEKSKIYNQASPTYIEVSHLYVGGISAQHTFNGQICHVAVYKRPLIAGEVQEHYNVGAHLK